MIAAALVAAPSLASADCQALQEAAADTRAVVAQLLGHSTNATTTLYGMVLEGRLSQDLADELSEAIAMPIIDDVEGATDVAVKWKNAAANCS